MRFIARFAKDMKDYYEVSTVYDENIVKEKIDKKEAFLRSIAKRYPAAVWFERKISDDFGITIKDIFDNRTLFKHERFPKGIFPLRKDFDQKEINFSNDYREYKYERVSGDSVFEVSVGPIHAGIIEPGHFHFSQAGEDILHLEVRHFYKYRAIEKMLEGKTLFEAKKIIEKISGNESVAYQIAWRDIVCKSCDFELDERLKIQHAFLLELERLIHHLTDLGFIPNDAGFSSALAYASKMAEDSRRVMKKITSHRFGFGGIDFTIKEFDKEYLNKFLLNLEDEMKFFEDWILDIPSLWDRFDTTGILTKDEAKIYSCVGVVARASGIEVDRRNDGFYQDFGYQMITENKGDVASRFKVRLYEVFNSITMMKNFLNIDFSINKQLNEITDNINANDGEYISFCESSIGELFMYIFIKNGVIDRFFVRDPSFINWQALHLMMPNNIIADFPLINKSCDLSYAGNDL